jgi:hypothetical protein
MWVRTEVRVTPARIRNMGIDLGGAQVRVAEHLLHRAQVRAPLEEMRGEGMAEEVGMHPCRIETRFRGQAPEDEEGAGTGQPAALRVEEELRAVPAIEERPAPGEVAAHGLDAFASERDDPLLVSLAEAPNDAVVQVDPAAVEPHRLADPEPGSVEELDQGAVAERSWSRPVRRLDQALDLAGRERAGEARAAPWEVELGGRVVLSAAEEDEVVVEGARRGGPPSDGGRGLAAPSQVGEPRL